MSRNPTLLLCTLLTACDRPQVEPEGPGDSRPDAPDTGGTPDTDDDTEIVPSEGSPWVRQEQQAPGTVTFTELAYHLPGEEELEWIELHNPMVLDLDLSGWTLDGGVSWTFPEGTILAAGGYLVLASDPDRLEEESGHREALGPFEGQLSNSGERLALYNNGGRLIDTVAYGDDDPWPVQADGSGLTLAKLDPDAASDRAEHWAASTQIGGTPGEPNLLDPDLPPTERELVPEDATWRYDAFGVQPLDGWAEPGFDDSGWASGQAPFWAGESAGAVTASAWATADNYFALYLGRADGSDLRLVGEDSDGSWYTVEEIELELSPVDHLFLAAWELTGDSGSPQMCIAEVELPDEVVGTDIDGFEWVLGPSGANPGGLPTNPPPSEEELALLIQDADDAGAWAPPAVEAGRSSSPWGGSVGSWFSDAAHFVWGDTFDPDSLTNQEDTYALFRSRAPISAPLANLELDSIPTTITFRTDFELHDDPGATELELACTIDDGAVVWLNGVEVLRENMPEGAVDASSLASSAVEDPIELWATISSEPLLRGANVLAVEVHQAELHDPDVAFGCSLWSRTYPSRLEPTLVLNEIAGGTGSRSWVELLNVSDGSQEVDLVLTTVDDAVAVAADALAPGELLLLEGLGLDLEAGEPVFLHTADGSRLLDAVRVQSGPRARDRDAGPWRSPSEATPGEPNLIELAGDVVINEIMYHRAPLSLGGEPLTARDEEWIELFNRGTTAVDLSGWLLVDAVSFRFPEGTSLAPGGFLVVAGDAESLRAAHPDAPVIGDLEGRLDNGSDRILLLDARGNPADELRYHDGGRWPAAADGGGSSLELRDPWADNSAAEAWAASDEGERSAWAEHRYRGPAGSSAVGPDGVWEELVLGLLDAGEVLIDDLSVIRDPDGATVEQVLNGGFDDDAHWRLLGNHRHSAIVPDPDEPSNPVLHLVATGPTEHMHNHAETTLREAIGPHEYEISFRARWLSGSNQLNSRLYFNRLARTTLLEQPELSGTPGAANSTLAENLGPTFSDLAQDPAVPAPFEPVLIAVSVDDPDGIAGVTLWSSVDGAAPGAQPMVEEQQGRWTAELSGREDGAIVQFWVEAEDGLGASATFPAAGPDSRALIGFDDSEVGGTGLHAFRILMTRADSDWLHEDINLMSNDRVGATVVYQDAEVFYDVGVRGKGSERGRVTQPRLGYGVRFRDDQPFRGGITSVLIDRSEGVGFGQREVLLNLVMTRAGSVHGEYNDLIHLVAPRSDYTGSAELQLDRFSDLVLASQFADGDAGRRFEYELIYYPTTTDDGTDEGYKLPQPDSVIGTSLRDLGEDEESYRYNFIAKNNQREDDYDGLMDLCRAMGLSTPELLEVAPAVIDVEQWLRAFAFATLSGATDQYGGAGSQHNAQFYQRPEDGLWLYFPHDLDYFGSSSMAVVNNSDLGQLLEDPANARSYYGHLQDIIQRAYHTDYLGPWCDQLGALLPGQSFSSHCQFIDTRADWVMYGSSEAVMTRYPSVGFRITTGGGGEIEVESAEVTLEGSAWIDVRAVALEGQTEPLDLAWLDGTTWQLTVPLEAGPNDVVLVATDLHGEVVGTDTIVVTSTGG